MSITKVVVQVHLISYEKIKISKNKKTDTAIMRVSIIKMQKWGQAKMGTGLIKHTKLWCNYCNLDKTG
jgi:hypothetical protein